MEFVIQADIINNIKIEFEDTIDQLNCFEMAVIFNNSRSLMFMIMAELYFMNKA